MISDVNFTKSNLKYVSYCVVQMPAFNAC